MEEHLHVGLQKLEGLRFAPAMGECSVAVISGLFLRQNYSYKVLVHDVCKSCGIERGFRGPTEEVVSTTLIKPGFCHIGHGRIF